MNFLKETIQFLASNDLTPEDVCWVSDGDNWCDWSTFKANADFGYDDGFGCQQINFALKVVGKDWWLERHEYDGSEWWEFKKLPEKPAKESSRIKLR